MSTVLNIEHYLTVFDVISYAESNNTAIYCTNHVHYIVIALIVGFQVLLLNSDNTVYNNAEEDDVDVMLWLHHLYDFRRLQPHRKSSTSKLLPFTTVSVLLLKHQDRNPDCILKTGAQ